MLVMRITPRTYKAKAEAYCQLREHTPRLICQILARQLEVVVSEGGRIDEKVLDCHVSEEAAQKC